MQILGIDIGGTGIKGAPVDSDNGSILVERYRLPPPEGAKPTPIAEIVKSIAMQFGWHAPIGCGFPAVIRNGVAESAANINQKWIGPTLAPPFCDATWSP